MAQYRQGDVLLVAVDQIPPDASPTAPAERAGLRFYLIEQGEAPGHAHVIEAAPGMRAWRSADAAHGLPDFIEIGDRPALLTHEEHDAIELPMGRYRIARQREFDPARAPGSRAFD